MFSQLISEKFSCDAVTVGGTAFLEPTLLPAFARQARTEELRVRTDEAPGSHIQGPTIRSKRPIPAIQPRDIDDLIGVLARRLVTDVVIARQGQPGPV